MGGSGIARHCLEVGSEMMSAGLAGGDVGPQDMGGDIGQA
jgi:hypothetical protein